MGSANTNSYRMTYKERPPIENNREEFKNNEEEQKQGEEQRNGEQKKEEPKDEEEQNKEEKNKENEKIDEELKDRLKEEDEEKNGKEHMEGGQNDSKIPEGKMITVIIPLINGSWEKTYNIECTLDQIASDFKSENNMNSIQKNHYIEFSYKNQPIDMNKTPLKSLVGEDCKSIHIAQEIKPVPGTEKIEESESIDIIGRPIFNPFQIFTFEIKQNVIKKRYYNFEKIKEKQLDKFGVDSTYCNGNNHLFISGGIEPGTHTNIGLFWDIDLKSNVLEDPVQMIPKKNHSMIYIEKKVYIVGGDNKSTMIYDKDNKEIIQWATLKYKRFEPSLIRHENYLFCFDTSKNYMDSNIDNIFNFEKIDIYSNQAEWELVNPNISPNSLDLIFNQKFFGVVEDYKQNIIFVGGIYYNDDNNIENDKNKKRMNIQYNITKNKIEKSDIEYQHIGFDEKTFLPFDNKTYYILSNFNKHAPEVIYFYKDKNIVEIKKFHSLHKIKDNNRKSKKNSKVKISQIKDHFKGLNFNMPNFNNINNNSNSMSSNRQSSEEKYENDTIVELQKEIKEEFGRKIEEELQKKIEKEIEEERKIKEELEKEIKEQFEKKIDEELTKFIIFKEQGKSLRIHYVEPVSLSNFHSSLDRRLNINSRIINTNNLRKKNIIKNIVLPKNIDINSIKKQMKNINKNEYKDFKEIKNY